MLISVSVSEPLGQKQIRNEKSICFVLGRGQIMGKCLEALEIEKRVRNRSDLLDFGQVGVRINCF